MADREDDGRVLRAIFSHEKLSLPPAALGLLRQWERLTMKQDLLYRTYQEPDGGEWVDQLVLPECLREEVFQRLHNHHVPSRYRAHY
ncbi:hypothetical protein PBY51_003375 [Eleginops maclovinus]|uniref:Uncharacterized protein n=1 Tax=Eleginops maclovinus TaxID=56733 RepID=A0AAN8ALF7_ELEMC|nr:hypothetical protein PBY51_003375 [Eleginops maclovinus]